jgi:hypothetical protein
MHVLNDAEFRRTFRFSKDGVDALVLMLHDQLSFDDGRNDPVTPLQQVLVALNHYAGGHFQRTSALCAGISQPTACRIIHRVSRALCEHKAEHIYMPSPEEMVETAAEMMDRFGVPRLACGVDGMHARLENAPRKLPPGVVQQDFFNRKGFYSFNVQAVCCHRGLFRDIDPDWAGKTHDARIWMASAVRQFVEDFFGTFLVVGDSAYPMSKNLVKPFSNREAAEDVSMRHFNSALSGARTVMTENVFALYKQRFPINRTHTSNYENSKNIIIATAILHNIAVKMRELEPEDDDEVLDLLRYLSVSML